MEELVNYSDLERRIHLARRLGMIVKWKDRAFLSVLVGFVFGDGGWMGGPFL